MPSAHTKFDQDSCLITLTVLQTCSLYFYYVLVTEQDPLSNLRPRPVLCQQ